MITLQQYWMGRDYTHRGEMTPDLVSNATELVKRVNWLLEAAAIQAVTPGIDEHTRTHVASGWRPAGINARTTNAATGSRHIYGLAVDLQDTLPERPLARWCLRNLELLEEIGLWMENPQWTPDWVHLQSVPPASERRVYIPSSKPALVAALPEQVMA